MRVAIFGGSFDPPHFAHLQAVQWALACGEVDRVLIIPCFDHLFGKASAPFHMRLEMARLAFAPMGDQVEVSDLESKLPVPSRTLATLQELRRRHRDWELRLLVGSDILAERERWHRFDEVVELAPLLVVGRPGWPAPVGAARLPDLSSSQVRQLVAAGEPVSALVPGAVADYIAARGLYRQGEEE